MNAVFFKKAKEYLVSVRIVMVYAHGRKVKIEGCSDIQEIVWALRSL